MHSSDFCSLLFLSFLLFIIVHNDLIVVYICCHLRFSASLWFCSHPFFVISSHSICCCFDYSEEVAHIGDLYSAGIYCTFKARYYLRNSCSVMCFFVRIGIHVQ